MAALQTPVGNVKTPDMGWYVVGVVWCPTVCGHTIHSEIFRYYHAGWKFSDVARGILDDIYIEVLNVMVGVF